MTAPLTTVECELLEAVVERRDGALAVLGDYWIEHVDEVRGAFIHQHADTSRDRIDLADEEARLAEYAAGWRAPLVQAGCREDDLPLLDGFLQYPPSIPAGHPLDGDPDLVRLSPRYYREQRVMHGAEHVVVVADEVTPRTTVRVAVKVAIWDDVQPVLEREHAILSRLSHPNLPRVLGRAIALPRFARDSASRALVLAWAGIDVRELLGRTREHARQLGAAFAIAVGVQLLDALAAIHRAGIVHQRVVPAHVMIGEDGKVTLIDFAEARAAEPVPYVPGDRLGLNRNGIRFRYMTPEQLMGEELDHAADVFSAALVISELVANEHPLGRTDSDFETVRRVCAVDQRVSPALPPTLAEPLQRALSRDATRRPTASELRATLVANARAIGLAIGPHVIAQRLVELGVPT